MASYFITARKRRKTRLEVPEQGFTDINTTYGGGLINSTFIDEKIIFK